MIYLAFNPDQYLTRQGKSHQQTPYTYDHHNHEISMRTNTVRNQHILKSESTLLMHCIIFYVISHILQHWLESTFLLCVSSCHHRCYVRTPTFIAINKLTIVIHFLGCFISPCIVHCLSTWLSLVLSVGSSFFILLLFVVIGSFSVHPI